MAKSGAIYGCEPDGGAKAIAGEAIRKMEKIWTGPTEAKLGSGKDASNVEYSSKLEKGEA